MILLPSPLLALPVDNYDVTCRSRDTRTEKMRVGGGTFFQKYVSVAGRYLGSIVDRRVVKLLKLMQLTSLDGDEYPATQRYLYKEVLENKSNCFCRPAIWQQVSRRYWQA